MVVLLASLVLYSLSFILTYFKTNELMGFFRVFSMIGVIFSNIYLLVIYIVYKEL